MGEGARTRALTLGQFHAPSDVSRFALTFLDRRVNQVAPLCPASVVVADLVEAEQVFEHKPGVRAALADAAIGDRLFIRANALVAVKLCQFVVRLEGAVFVRGL